MELQFQYDIPSRGVEKRYMRKNGEIMWASLSAAVIRDQEGKPLYRVGLITDITELKRAEAELRLDSEIFANDEEGMCLVGSMMESSSIPIPNLKRCSDMTRELIGNIFPQINAPPADLRRKLRRKSGKRWCAPAYGGERSCISAKMEHPSGLR